ncbi:unnamed protein product, partial [Laminaria digitata]
MQDNSALREGLGAVVGLNFDELPAEHQLQMMKSMTTTRHEKARQNRCCELLVPGEIAAVSSRLSDVDGTPTPSSKGIRLHAGQYFGEKALLRLVESTRSDTMIAASTVVDIASMEVTHSAVWEPFRTFLLMKKVPLLASLSMPTLHILREALQLQTFYPGEYLVRQGDVGEEFYMIVEGTVDVLEEYIDPDTGRRAAQFVVQMFDGHYFGELALIYGEPRNASVRASGEVRCVCITKEDFRSCMKEKRFQEILEEVAHQRSFYREQRAQQREQKVGVACKTMRLTLTPPPPRSPPPDLSRVFQRGRALSSQGSFCPGRNVEGGRGDHAHGVVDASSPQSTHSQSVRETGKVTTRKLENGTVVINKYRILSLLGRGSYGTVHLCRNEDTGGEYAMKVMSKSSRGLRPKSHNHLAETLRREVAVMKKLRHPNIVTLLEVIDDPKAEQIYIIQEYVENGPLLPELLEVEPLPAEEAREKIVGCMRGLHHLHQYGVVHGDIKPQNLLVAKDGTVKITDFGAATMLQHEVCCETDEGLAKEQNILISTPAFTPPELFGAGLAVRCVMWS